MKIGVDCRLSGLQNAGIGRYVSNLVRRFPFLDKKISWVYFFSSQKQADEVLTGLQKYANLKIVIAPIRHYSIKEQFILPGYFSQEKLDLLYVPHFNIPIFYRGKIVITIHDLLWHQQRGSEVTTLSRWVYWLKYVAYLLIVSLATIKAKKIFAPSNFVKQSLANYYPWTKEKTFVTLEGVDEHYLEQPLQTNSQQNKKNKLLVYTGSLYPHKNLPLVLKALQKMPDYRLLIIGSRNIFREKTQQLIQQLKIEQQVSFAGYLDDAELVKTYQRATALVVPSFSEGFGLPGVEAMSVGLVVLASDIPIFKEIYRDTVIYFDPRSIDSFVEAVRVLENTNLANLIKKAKQLSQKYNWDDTAKKILDESIKI